MAATRKRKGISSPVRWIGGKGTNYQWIISHFPEHRCYVESFGGGASVLLNKPPTKVEIYNDLDERLIALFDVLRHPELGKLLQAQLALTPYHESEFKRAWDSPPPEDQVEYARWVMIKLRMAFGGCGSRDQKPGFAFGKAVNQALSWSRKVDELDPVIDRLRRVTIMSRAAIDVIKRFDSADTLHYCDPPYVHDSRKSKRCYRFEMTDTDHEQLAEVLNNVQGKVVLSGYDCDLYKRLYKGWRQDHRVQKLACSKDKTQTRTETIWMNFQSAITIGHGYDTINVAR
jgi:DNA adenine methylase